VNRETKRGKRVRKRNGGPEEGEGLGREDVEGNAAKVKERALFFLEGREDVFSRSQAKAGRVEDRILPLVHRREGQD